MTDAAAPATLSPEPLDALEMAWADREQAFERLRECVAAGGKLDAAGRGHVPCRFKRHMRVAYRQQH